MKIFRILALLTISFLLFTGCEDDEINYAFQEISAPTEVSANFDISQDDTGTVTITPIGVGAQTFQVDLGNGEVAEIATGESITTVYDEGDYMIEIVAVGSTGLTSEYNQMLTISFKAPEDLVINVDQPATNPSKITVSATANNATVFDVYFGDMDNEEPTQLMPGETVEHIYEPGVYELTVIARGAGAATLEEDEIIVVAEASNPLKLPVTFDDPLVGYAVTPFGAEGTAFEIVQNPQVSGTNDTASMVGMITKTGAQFEGVTFNLGEAADLSGDDKTFSVKIYSEVAFPVLLKLETGVNGERSNEVAGQHEGTGWETVIFNFAIDATTSYIDNNDTGGAMIVPDGQFDSISLFLDQGGDAAGTFYIDDFKKGQEVQAVIDPTEAASSPTAAQENVRSIFSDSYTNPANINYFPDWGQSTTYEMISLNGDNVIKYDNANYQGIDIGESIDATAFEFINIDVWSGDYTSIPFFLISSTGENSVTLEVVPNQWNTIQIPLSDFTSQGLNITDVFQFKFDVQPDNGGSFYIDNLYFSNEVAAPGEPVSAASTPTAAASNVRSIYSDTYTNPAAVNYYPGWGQSTQLEVLDFNGNEVIKYSDANYQGIEFGENIDATGFETIHIDVWSADYASVAFFLISGSGENPVTLDLVPNQWNSIEIPLQSFVDQGLDISNVIQIKFDVQPDNGGTFYIDNIYFHN